MKYPYKILFTISMMTGTMMAISASSWFMSWIGLEINLLSFIPLMPEKKNNFSSEASIKYFITQALSSSLLLFSILLISIMKNMSLSTYTLPLMLINLTLMMKMGAAPFHFWLPEVTSGLNWEMVFLTLSWQKIAPMILMSMSLNSSLLLSIFIISSTITGSIQGLNQTCLRKILTYSSINHTGWMLATMMNSLTIWIYYFLIYSFTNFYIISTLSYNKVYFMNQLNSLFSFNKKIMIFFSMNFMSLGGLPPFIGFFPKWFSINILISNNQYTLTLILILFTLIALYYYMRLTFSSFSLGSSESIKYFSKYSSYLFIFNSMILFSLPISMIQVTYL
uniref:NADH-ubiquinone oxidoreductase chain 2 n=1 Tax=Curculionoidea sp. 16 KM-2017 TaxID=2219399 RepID=A0A346RK49_9CUCU|nr:NADH dehydrogenase subunit 2 [Curculionoidea sp. 16 KM-2017]